jgi:predicted enzyme related to lactoylglutathione lyase
MLAEHPVFPILLSTDLDATRRFYPDTRSTVGTSDTQTQMAWRVPDIHAALAELRARGVRIEEYEAPDPVTTDGVADMGHSWAAWFIDPSRNVLAVVQPT